MTTYSHAHSPPTKRSRKGNNYYNNNDADIARPWKRARPNSNAAGADARGTTSDSRTAWSFVTPIFNSLNRYLTGHKRESLIIHRSQSTFDVIFYFLLNSRAHSNSNNEKELCDASTVQTN